MFIGLLDYCVIAKNFFKIGCPYLQFKEHSVLQYKKNLSSSKHFLYCQPRHNPLLIFLLPLSLLYFSSVACSSASPELFNVVMPQMYMFRLDLSLEL